MVYSFEWDPEKDKSNLQKHKISFERAAEIFLNPFMLSIFDDMHSDDEERWITIGKDSNNVTIVVVHTFTEIDPESYIKNYFCKTCNKKRKQTISFKIKL